MLNKSKAQIIFNIVVKSFLPPMFGEASRFVEVEASVIACARQEPCFLIRRSETLRRAEAHLQVKTSNEYLSRRHNSCDSEIIVLLLSDINNYFNSAMKLKALFFQIILGLSIISVKGQIQITVYPAQEIKEISPYIYGRNNNLSDDPKKPTVTASWQLYKDAGLKFLRESGGNNSTKYNWRKKLSSHPDWYNNVYAHDWDYAAQSLQTNMPDVKGMWAFQLLGYVAKTGAYNFNDWGYNGSQWWKGVAQNLAGGGTVNPDPNSTKALVAGDINLYLQPWTADSTTAILSQWFDKLGLSKEQFQYWNMDNEPDCWNGTHDDVVTSPMPVEDYIQKYVAVAKKARALFPNIKIVGPVFTNEWQWYNWQNGDAVTDPITKKKYCWAEYFIKRISEEQQKAGVRLLDVLDFHFYPNVNRDVTLQLYRVFYDMTYVFPQANGVYRLNGGWDTSINKEYIFKRATDWLTQYMGVNNGVTMGMSELGSLYSSDPNVIAVGYASLLGTFAKNNVEIFAPWEWDTGQWEVLHLFTHYAGSIAVNSTSSLDTLVSAYSSINAAKDTLSVILVNRDITNSQSVNISLANTTVPNKTVSCYQLSNLPTTETFISATQNALKQSSVILNNNSIALTLPKLSVTAIQIPLKSSSGINSVEEAKFQLYPNPAKNEVMVETSGFSGLSKIAVCDMNGKTIKAIQAGNTGLTKIDLSELDTGIYIVNLNNNNKNYNQKLIVE